jgi:DNA-binding transcriptional LysR family regulator
MMFGRLYVAPIVLDFLGRHPQVVARTLLVDRVVDLVDEGIDVAVRIAHLQDSSLNAVRVGAVRRVVCASPGYLAEHGRPRTPADLSRFEAIVFSQTAAQQGWSFTSGSKVQTVTPPSRLAVNTAEVAIEAAVAGRGLTRVLSYQIATELRRGQLELVLEDFEPPPIPIHVVHSEGRRANARVRAFVDFSVERLRAQESLSVRE